MGLAGREVRPRMLDATSPGTQAATSGSNGRGRVRRFRAPLAFVVLCLVPVHSCRTQRRWRLSIHPWIRMAKTVSRQAWQLARLGEDSNPSYLGTTTDHEAPSIESKHSP